MNRDTIAYRRFIEWWWPFRDPSTAYRGPAPGQDVKPADRVPPTSASFGVGSPYLRPWLLLGALGASQIFAGLYLTSGAAAANGESILTDLVILTVWTIVNAVIWMAIAFRRYAFRILAPLCAAFFGVYLVLVTYFWAPLTFVLLISPAFTRTPPADRHAKSIALAAIVAVPLVAPLMWGVSMPFR